MTQSNQAHAPSQGKPPATVELVEEKDAQGVVAEVFADIRRTKGIDFVPNFWRTLATYPPLLEETWRRVKTTMQPGRIDLRTKEMLAVAVSATNGCPYCVQSHTAALRKLGVDDETLGELMAVVGLFNSTNALANAYQVEPDVFPPTKPSAVE